MEGAQGTTAGGNVIGKYRLIAELGHGGMAEVFLAVVRGPAGFNKLVVIKQIRPQLAEDPEFLGMFLDEARLAARLSHPNVVQTNEVGEEDGRYFIAMEYLEGQPLNRVIHRLHKTGGFPLAMHLKVVCQTLAGLHHAHELCDYDGTPLGVVHRDVTPHNLFITYEGQVKVVDFGIAKALNSSSETRSGVLKGKVAYMAPEQARGDRVDRRADVFSVGVVLWEAVTGKRLWKGVPDITILQRLLAGDIPPPRSIRPEIPEKLEAIVLKALAHQRDDRYATAAELQLALEHYLDEIGERVHERDLGKLLATAFEGDRAKIKAIIDEQLRAKASGPSFTVTNSALPIIDTTTHSGTGAQSGRTSGSVSDSSNRVEIIGPHSGSASYTAPSSLFTSAGDKPAASSSRRGLFAAGALTLGAAAALLAWQLTKAPAGGATAAASAAAGAASAAASEKPADKPAAPAEVEINITAVPAEAKIFLDDVPLAGNPFKGKVPRDDRPHQVRVEAPGHAPRTQPLTLDRDRTMDLVLVKEAAAEKPAAARAPVAVTPTAAPPPAAEEPARPNAKKPQRKLDQDNPYAK